MIYRVYGEDGSFAGTAQFDEKRKIFTVGEGVFQMRIFNSLDEIGEIGVDCRGAGKFSTEFIKAIRR